MSKLNQIVAVEKSKKTRANRVVSDQYKLLQKPQLFNGLLRSYKPLNDEGTTYPDENQVVQASLSGIVEMTREALSDLFDVTAIKDYGNCVATADVVVDEEVILEAVPVTYLLFLEKQLTDLRTFFAAMPQLDTSEQWTLDQVSGYWRGASTETLKTKKVPRNHVKAEATHEHPAQVEMYMEDVAVGTWTNTRLSSALPGTRVRALVSRVDSLLDAVRFARERANETEVENKDVGSKVFDYLLGAD